MKNEFIDSRQKCRAIDASAIGEPDNPTSLAENKKIHTETDLKTTP